ncbi:MAG: RNA polymerase sigma factor [Agriterribacter sp.]
MPIASKYDEQELLCLLRTGDKTAFTQLYHLYSKKLFLNIYRLVKIQEVAEEILQEIFVLIWEKRETIVVHQSFKGYLFRIAENKVTDFFRKLHRDRVLFERVKEVSSSVYTHIEEKLFSNESASVFRKAIDALPPQRRQVFCLCKMEGRSYSEVSRLLGISTSTINDHIVKATRSVRECLLANKETATLGCLLYFMFGL